MESYESLIHELAELKGLVPDYWDVFGTRHFTTIETKKAVLKAMGKRIDSEDALRQEIEAERRRPWDTFIEPVLVFTFSGQPVTLSVYVPVAEGRERELVIAFTFRDEQDGRDDFSLSGGDIVVSDHRWFNGVRYAKIGVTDRKVRPPGYYTAEVSCKSPALDLSGTTALIIAPEHCYIPPELEQGRCWGVSLNLYSLKSRRNWGIGDFSDLMDVIGESSAQGCSFVGINPLHAIPNKRPYGVSPYSPVSRLYRNFIYLDVERIPEVRKSRQTQAILRSKTFRKKIEETRESDLIDYKGIASLKRTILRHAFDEFFAEELGEGAVKSPRAAQFRDYVEREGEVLQSYALFITLWEYMNSICKVYAWQDWHEEYRDPSSAAVRAFASEQQKEITFLKYLQWLIHEQLEQTCAHGRDAGMSVGLYQDLAVGSIGGGSDAWTFQTCIARGIEIGAPPDEFNPTGQCWGFPPSVPDKLKETGYRLFIDTIGKSMQHSGAVRIDHALGLFRLFWVPEGMTAADGAYVRQPADDLLKIIALESVRNKTIVIAEDLGTVGEDVRDILSRHRMLSYRLLYFERNYPDPSFTPPDRYPDLAICAVTTHDLPTLPGYWTCRDIVVKRHLGILSDKSTQHSLAERERDKGLLLVTLRARGLLPGDFPEDHRLIPEMTDELCLGVYEYLAQTPCKLTGVSLDDIAGAVDQQNMPGTVVTYPNWLQKMPVPFGELLGSPVFTQLADRFRRSGRCVSAGEETR